MSTNKTPFALTALTIASLAFAGWSLSRPAHAQDDPPQPNFPQPGGGGGRGGQPPMGRPGRGGMGGFGGFGGGASIAASNNAVYVLRGDTLYEMRANDLSLITQKRLPAPNGGPMPGGGDGGNFPGGPQPGGGAAPPPPNGNGE